MDKVLADAITKGIEGAVQPEGSLIVKVKQATGVYVDSIIYNRLTDIREIDFSQKLGAPAGFLRIRASQTSIFEFKNYAEMTEQKTTEWKRDPEGLTATIPRLYVEENLYRIKITPSAFPCTIDIWADKKGVQKEFLK